jgi:folate-binding protein YgfZ
MEQRSIIAIGGPDRISFLQGILTQDVGKLGHDKIQFTALLSPQGKILHDMFLISDGERILIDIAQSQTELFLRRLAMYKLRAKVTIDDISVDYYVSYDPAGLPDPRHAELPHRRYSTEKPIGGHEGEARHALQLGIPELGRDFAADSVVALDAGYDLLNGVSFTKGCYVGQEITARMHYKNIARRGFYILTNDTAATRLALLKFEEVEARGGVVTVDNLTCRATLPAWMAPKFAQFKTAHENQ